MRILPAHNIAISATHYCQLRMKSTHKIYPDKKWTKCIIVLVLRLIAQRYISPGAIILAVWIHCGRMSHRIKCLPHLFAALLPPSLNQHSVLDNLCAKNY